MSRTPQDPVQEQTTKPSPIIKNYYPKMIKYACNCLKHQNIFKNHNFEVGLCVLGFGEHDGKIYYKIL